MAKAQVLFDTNVFIAAFQGTQPATELLKKLVAEHQLAVSPIVVAELHASPDQEHADKIDLLLPYLKSLPVTTKIGKLAGDLRKSRKKQIGKVYLMDCLLAATAISHHLEFFTYNKDDFKFEELKLKKL